MELDTLRERVLEATQDLSGTARTVLIITHGGSISALCAHLLWLPPKRVVPVSPGSLTVLELPAAEHATFEPGSAKLHTFNWRPHGALLDVPTDLSTRRWANG